MIGRRGFITGLISLVAAPAIVRAGSLMPVKVLVEPIYPLYGHSPAMEMLGLLDGLEERIRIAFFADLGAFGTAAIEIRSSAAVHIPFAELH